MCQSNDGISKKEICQQKGTGRGQVHARAQQSPRTKSLLAVLLLSAEIFRR
jgi:hypothetical protein